MLCYAMLFKNNNKTVPECNSRKKTLISTFSVWFRGPKPIQHRVKTWFSAPDGGRESRMDWAQELNTQEFSQPSP